MKVFARITIGLIALSVLGFLVWLMARPVYVENQLIWGGHHTVLGVLVGQVLMFGLGAVLLVFATIFTFSENGWLKSLWKKADWGGKW